MAVTKPIQLILARQLASCVAMAILLFDENGTLVFYNEAAEVILNQRFEETGEIPADDFVQLIEVADENRNPLPADQRPTSVTRRERRPLSRTIWARSVNSEWRHLQVTAVPLVGDADRMLGVMHLFWET